MVYVERHDGQGVGGGGAETGDAVVFFGVEGGYGEGFVEELGVCCCCHFGRLCGCLISLFCELEGICGLRFGGRCSKLLS